MSDNTQLWDKLGKTDPAHTKAFTRAGGFKGTAIKPMWSYRRMTEEFGPCGKGWGIYAPAFQTVAAGDEVLVYCTVSIWYEKPEQIAFGVGGDKAVAKSSSGVRSDDEAFKKAYTDAVTNALKMIGVGADVHMGMFDDSKYVNGLKQEFSHENENPAPAKSSAQLKRDGEWERVSGELENDLLDCHSLVTLESLKADYRQKVSGWTAAWKNALKDLFDAHEDKLIKAREQEEAESDFHGDTNIKNAAGRRLHSLEA